MIVTFEKSLDSYTKRSGLFGNEYVYEFIGPDIDMSKFNYISVVDCFIVCERETINTGHVPLFANFFSQIFLANYRCLPTFGKQRFTANFFSQYPTSD